MSVIRGCRYERDEIKPSIEVAKKIADALEVTVDYLLGNGAQLKLDKKTARRIQAIQEMPEEEREKLFYVLDMAIRDYKTRKAISE